MGGLAKQKQYQYSKDGKFLKEYESLSSVNEKYKLTKGNFYSGRNYRRMDDNTWICSERLGRNAIIKLERIYNCPFCSKKDRSSMKKPLEVYNLLGEKIAEFSSGYIFNKMTGLPLGTISNRANSKKKQIRRENNLIIKFK